MEQKFPPASVPNRIPQDVVQQQRQHPLLANLFLVSTGYFISAFGHETKREAGMVDSYLMMYCLNGQGWFSANGQTWPITKGNVVFAFENIAHAYGADVTDPWTIQWAHFIGTDTPHLLGLANVSLEQPVISIGERLHIVALFNEILAILQSGYSLHHLINASACLRQILANITLLNTYAPSPETKSLHVEKIINFMLENISKPCHLDDFAAYACLSPSHFSRQFHAKTGYAPIDYFIRLKIQKACELLESTDMTIGEVSRYLGYGDQYYFTRVFKKVMGMPPKQYRSR